MNKAKYEGVPHPVRETNDLKDIVTYSCEHFADTAAYLQKDRPGGTFQPITYRQVKEDLDAFGTKLIDMGLKGKKIAVIGETSYLWFLTYMTVVCGVGVIVPLDKNLPKEEVKNLIRRSGADALVYSAHSEKSIRELFDEPYELKYFISMAEEAHTEKVLSLTALVGEGKGLLKRGMRDYVDAVIDPDQMATLIYTSGTTGQAKGVMLSHRNIAKNCQYMSERMHLGEGWVVLSILPTHHTFENTCVDWTTFYQGKTLAICEGIKYITKNMNEVHANCLVAVPLVFEKIYKGMMKQADARGQGEKLRNAIALSHRMKLYNNPALMKRMFKTIHDALGGNMKQFIAGGAAIDPKVIEDFEAMGIPMMQGYGMTECAPIIAVNQDNCSVAKSVGRPMNGTEVKIVDPDGDGMGEIACKSPSVMLGYYQDEAATAAVIRDGWLYTGDLGYMDEKGYLYITGRKKTVIVTKGGKNIFPEELEEVLKQNELVKECLVHGITDKKIGNVIIAADIQPNYALLKEQKGEMSDNEVYHFYKDLVDEVNRGLPAYKAMKRVNIRKTDFAMTTTGKIKRYGNFVEGEENEGSVDYVEIKAAERKRAEQLIADIANSDDRLLRYRTGRPITDVRQMFNSSVELWGDRPLFHQKFKKGGEFSVITYKEAQANVNGLGTALINHGLGGKRIAIIGDTCSQWETTYLAVIGGVGMVVPLDKELASRELKYLINDAEVSAVVYTKKFDSIFRQMVEDGDTPLQMLINMNAEEHTEDVFSWSKLIQEGKDQLAQGDRQYLDAEIIGGDPAVILYTSGTTGMAKGVMLSNTNLAEDLMMAPTILNVGPEDIFFSVLPVHHTYECTCAFLMPIYKGASIAFCEGLKYITKNLQEVKPTMLLGVPVLIETLYKRIWKGVREKGKEKTLRRMLALNKRTKKIKLDLSPIFSKDIKEVFGGNMRVLISGGAAINPEILQFFNDIGIICVQGYGLTECSPMAALNPDVEADMRHTSVGHLLPGMGVKIVDKDENGVGEICFSGGNVMLGYYKNPEATAEVLKDGWFHTGDLGYVDEDDYIYITGRKKNVIITDNGKNVFPEELEYELSQIPYIAESMVWGAEGDGVNSTTIAATVLLDQDEIKETLGEDYTPEQAEKLVNDAIDELNERMPLFKKIKRVVIREKEFEKNTAKKIKRFVEENKEK